MPQFIAAFLGILALLAWLLLVLGLVLAGGTYFDDQPLLGIGFVLAAVVVFCGGFALIASGGDTEPTALCVRGHQEWVRTGKTTRKAWICDAREEPR